MLEVAAQLRRDKVDAVLCQEYEYPRFDVCVGLGAILGIRVFATFQGGNYRLTALERVLRPLTVRACSGLIIGSAIEAARVSRYRLRSEKVARIFNPLDMVEWGPGDRTRARAELGFGEGIGVVAWHGRVEIHRKGLDVLCDAWRRLSDADDGQNARLLLMGTGSDALQLRERILDQQLHGVCWKDEYLLDRRLLRHYLSAADVYVLPSRHEGFPVALIEAMACGLAVVAAEAPGVSDIIGEGETSAGIIVRAEDGDALASALGLLLGDEGLRCELGRRATRRAENLFSPETLGRQLRDFLTSRGAHRAWG